jgi:hypothetical protein
MGNRLREREKDVGSKEFHMRYRPLSKLSRRPMRVLGSVLLGYLGLAIACNCASAETPAARPLSMKEAVQLAMQQNPQRLIARLAVNERREDKPLLNQPFCPRSTWWRERA